MGLTVTRKVGETIQLDITPGTTAEELYQALQSGITITLIEYRSAGARIKVDAPDCLTIYRQVSTEA